MSETVRIRRPEGGWIRVRFYALGKIQVPGGMARGILVFLEGNDLPTAVDAKDVHPDDYRRLIETYAQN